MKRVKGNKQKQAKVAGGICPFRPGGYSAVWETLYAHREKGIERKRLISIVCRRTKDVPRRVAFNVSVVSSVGRDVPGHRSVRTAGNVYWVEKRDRASWLKLHLRQASDKAPTE